MLGIMKLGISFFPVSPEDDGQGLVRVAREVERLGFDSVLPVGKVLADPFGGAGLDPIVTLGTLATATERLRLISSVVVVPLYEPVVLANQAATLDVLSGGRFTMGVGVGWNDEEFKAVGVPFNERGKIADEYLEAMKKLWSERPTSMDGRYVSFEEKSLGVTTRTEGGPPLWVGGDSDGALRRALRFGDAWHGTEMTLDKVNDVDQRLQKLGEEVGRDAATLDRNGLFFLLAPNVQNGDFVLGEPLGGTEPTADSVIENIGKLEEAGLTHLTVLCPVGPDQILDAIRWVGEEVLPKVGD